MRAFALTYPQLMSQAIDRGLDRESLLTLRRSFDFTLPLADGIYRAQGVPLLDHLVRCASITLANGLPVHVAAASLMHAVFFLNCFAGSRRRRARRADRAQLRREVGSDVEQLIDRYAQVSWFSVDAVREHTARVGGYPSEQRHVLAMRLADELEDHLDDAMSFAPAGLSKPVTDEFLQACATLADGLQLTELAGDFRHACARRGGPALPAELVRSESRAYQVSGNAWRSNAFERLRYRVEDWWRR